MHYFVSGTATKHCPKYLVPNKKKRSMSESVPVPSLKSAFATNCQPLTVYRVFPSYLIHYISKIQAHPAFVSYIRRDFC